METNQLSTSEKLMDVLCPTRHVLGRLGDKWTILVVTALEMAGTQRFSKLRDLVGGVSQKVLTHALRGLERDGLVRREAFPTVPVTVEYSLTDLGHSLARVAAVVRDWSFDNIDAIAAAQDDYDARQEPVHS